MYAILKKNLPTLYGTLKKGTGCEIENFDAEKQILEVSRIMDVDGMLVVVIVPCRLQDIEYIPGIECV